MSEEEEQEQLSCKEIQLLDKKFAELVQRVTEVMPLADHLKSRNMIHDETYSKIKAEKTHQDQMRELYKVLLSGGDKVKKAFCEALKQINPHLYKDLTGEDNKKRKLSDAECHVPAKQKKLNTESDKPFNYNDDKISQVGSPSISNVTNIHIVTEKKPDKSVYRPPPLHYRPTPHHYRPTPTPFPWCITSQSPCIPNNSNSADIKLPAPKEEKKPPVPKKEKKPPAPKKEKKPPAPKKEKKPTAPKKEKKPPAPKKEKKPPAPKKEKKPTAPKKEKKPTAPKEEKKPTAPKEEKKPTAPKEEKKPTTPKKEKKPPVPKKEKKPPAPKKVKKSPAPKKVKKSPAPKKVKKSPAPKKVKKSPAPKKVKKPPAPKK